jgi:hypothetical protein
MIENPTRSTEQRDGKTELLVLDLTFSIGDATFALVCTEGYDVQSCEVEKRKAVSQEREYMLRMEGRERETWRVIEEMG